MEDPTANSSGLLTGRLVQDDTGVGCDATKEACGPLTSATRARPAKRLAL